MVTFAEHGCCEFDEKSHQ